MTRTGTSTGSMGIVIQESNNVENQNSMSTDNNNNKNDDYMTTNGRNEKEWAMELGNLSTPHLSSKLSALKTASASLSSALTAKLASSPSGQNLLHIGPSLSSLPPDLQQVYSSLEPLKRQIDKYMDANCCEFERIQEIERIIEIALRKAKDGEECKQLFIDILCAETCLNNVQQVERSSSHNNQSLKEESQIQDYLDLMLSLERSSQITLHLLQQLKLSSELVTSTLLTNTTKSTTTRQTSTVHDRSSSSNKSSSTTNDFIPTIDEHNNTLPVDTEKAHFIMKLAPRIRKLEKNTVAAITRNLDTILLQRMTRLTSGNEFLVKSQKVEDKEKVHTHIAEETPIAHDETNTYDKDPVEDSTSSPRQLEQATRQQELLAIGFLMRAMAILGRGREAESIFAKLGIMPIIRSKISLGKLDEGGARGECRGLQPMLHDIIHTIQLYWGDIFTYIEAMFMFENNTKIIDVDLVTAGVWIPIATAFMADPAIKMALFSPGIASILQTNYTTLDTFLSQLSSTLLTPSQKQIEIDTSLQSQQNEEYSFHNFYYQAQLDQNNIASAQERLYNNVMTQDFTKKWNLPIYYQLRFGEVCKRITKSIELVQKEGWDANVFTGDESCIKTYRDKHGFELSFFMEVYDALLWLWKPDIVLRPLTHRFLRGAVQILGCVNAFVKGGMEGNIKFFYPSQPDNNVNAPKNFNCDTYCWCDSIEVVANVAWNATVLERCIKKDYVEVIINQVASLSKGDHNISGFQNDIVDLKANINQLILEASKEILPMVSKAWEDIIVNSLKSKCSEPLLAVRGVAATYRMTNRPPPTQSSPFVSTILRPLKTFDRKYATKIPQTVDPKWKESIIMTVSSNYSKAVSELIETVQRTEEALKNRKARKAVMGIMSDGEKVKLQLYLDQTEFSRCVSELGVKPSLIEGVRQLVSLTQDAERLVLQSKKGDS